MYFETSEKLNGTFSPEREEVLKFREGVHTLSGPFFVRGATIFFTRIYHTTVTTLTVCIIIITAHIACFMMRFGLC